MNTTAVMTLESDVLALTVEPRRGGRITSLVHRPTGKELLWQQPRMVDWPRYGVSEASADVQGWDECLPAIGPGPFPPGPWQGVENPAQGEVYALPWEVMSRSPVNVEMRVHGVRFPYQLTRTIRLDQAAVLLSYQLHNHAALPFPFIWSAHPMLAAPAGGEIVLPGGNTSALIDSSDGGRLGGVYDRVDWPDPTVRDTPRCLNRVVPGAGTADKLYITSLAGGECSFRRADGPTIALHWDKDTIPYLGIWVDTRFAGSPQVALEPCLGYPDSMEEAARLRTHAAVEGHGVVEWSYVMTVGDSDEL